MGATANAPFLMGEHEQIPVPALSRDGIQQSADNKSDDAAAGNDGKIPSNGG